MSQQKAALNSAWLSNPGLMEHLKVQRCGWRVRRLLALRLLHKRARGRDLQGVQHVSALTCENCQSCFMHYFGKESGIHLQKEVYILSLPFLM